MFAFTTSGWVKSTRTSAVEASSASATEGKTPALPAAERDTHIRPTPLETLARIRPAFGGVQTGGNSSAIVDGAAGVLVASSDYLRKLKVPPLARVVACVAVVGACSGKGQGRATGDAAVPVVVQDAAVPAVDAAVVVVPPPPDVIPAEPPRRHFFPLRPRHSH